MVGAGAGVVRVGSMRFDVLKLPRSLTEADGELELSAITVTVTQITQHARVTLRMCSVCAIPLSRVFAYYSRVILNSKMYLLCLKLC